MTDDLPTRFLATRLAPVRQALWDNGEITIAGLRRLDEVLGIETYATPNQCDGCQRGLTKISGIHVAPEGYMACTAHRYTGEDREVR